MRYANVIVDLSADAVDRSFTYSVPDSMALCEGQQVVVPFGPRTMEGFVASIRDTCSIPPEKVRPVLRTVRDYPILLPELMHLADWMHKKYLCNLVDAMRLMIPAEMRGERVRDKTRRMVRLLLSPNEVDAFLRENTRAKKQAEILRTLQKGDAEVTAFSGSALAALVDKGAVEFYDEELLRAPRIAAAPERAADPVLTHAQQRAADELTRALSNGGDRFLLNGVTGSGKTEVYIRLIREVLAQGRTAIVLVPEIALTPQMVGWFHARFGDDAAVLHSGLSAGERYDEWRRLRFGKARVAIGARSAVFAPLENLGAIIVDEEHEHTYQSDRRPRYDAREVAWKRAEDAKAVLLLGSATPSIQTYMRAMPGVRPENRLKLLELPNRANGRPLPEVEIADMREEFARGNHSIFSATLMQAMEECFAQGRQAMLFINRRGHSSFVSCRACGYVEKCQQCDISMTYHQAENQLRCHYCGATREPPTKCPSCGSRYIKFFGAGTQRVQEEMARLFPNVRTVRMDLDTTRQKDAHARILERFRTGDAQVLIGTQMIAKGLDFPGVTLVGVIAADTTLNLPDYRSTERTFQLITQVAGRAGRADCPGRVIVQTYDPDHYALQMAAKQDFRAFYNRESAFRRASLYPPFTVIMRIVFFAKEPDAAQKAAEDAETRLNAFLDGENRRQDVVQMRALEAPIKRLRGESRWQVFLKMYFKGDLDATAAFMQSLADEPREGIRAEMEVNPANMY